MNFTNPQLLSLGTFTWAALQAAYPNGGGALAALPAGVTAFVSDWSAEFTPNAAKTRWRPIAPVVLGTTTAAIVNAVADGTNYVAFFALVPAGLVEPWGFLKYEASLEAAVNTNIKSWRIGVSPDAATAVMGGTTYLNAFQNNASNPNSALNGGIGFSATNPAALRPVHLANNFSVAGPAGSGLGGAFNMDTTACYAHISNVLVAGGVSMTINWARICYEPPKV